MSEDRERQENELDALESIFDDERLFVRSSDEFGGQLSVSVNLPDEFLVKYSKEEIRKKEILDEKPETEEEHSAYNEIKLKHLSPIVINFNLPLKYPSNCIPEYSLSCKWLGVKEISKLCQSLDEAYEYSGGNEILYEWTSILSGAFDILKITDFLVLQVDHGDSLDDFDKRAVQDISTMDGLVSSLISYNQSEETRLFQTSFINCSVCFNEKFGSLCIQFPQCKHVFCKHCMKDYFTVQIKDGSVKSLTCPEDKCETQADPALVKSLVDEELFERYDKLLLQKTLDCMSDIIFCPRKSCQAPVLKEEDMDMGRCATCGFVFCVLCNNTYHGRAKCSLTSKNLAKMREIYLNGTQEEREDLEKRYGKEKIARFIEEGYSEAWLERFSKKCPACKASIQKIDGCNKMTCFSCRRNFCWLCNSLLHHDNPYAHFNSQKGGCYNKLFEGLVELDDVEEMEEDEDGWIQFV